LVVGSGSIDLLLVETLIVFRVGGLGFYPLSSHSQMRLSWAVTMSFVIKVN
jgi:hypothetical protein